MLAHDLASPLVVCLPFCQPVLRMSLPAMVWMVAVLKRLGQLMRLLSSLSSAGTMAVRCFMAILTPYLPEIGSAA